MRRRFLAAAGSAAVLVALVISAAAPAAAQAKVPRTAWGKPDLEGIWDFRTITPLERPANMAGKEFLTEEEAAKLEKEVVDRNKAFWTNGPPSRYRSAATWTVRQTGHPVSTTISGWMAERNRLGPAAPHSSSIRAMESFRR